MSKPIQRPACPKCGSTNVIKNGHDKYHIQQFICKDCKHSFKLKHSTKRKNFSFPCSLLSLRLRMFSRSMVMKLLLFSKTKDTMFGSLWIMLPISSYPGMFQDIVMCR